jgi:quinol monooxygenase YgiN
MIKVVSRRTFREKDFQDILKIYEKMTEETRKEPGCLSYELFLDINDPNSIIMIEEWKSMEDLDKHNNTPHYREILPQAWAKQLGGDLRFLTRKY